MVFDANVFLYEFILSIRTGDIVNDLQAMK